jgi:hypothetical protein
MKIEIIKECAGMTVGMIKDVPEIYAKELIEIGLAKSTEVKAQKTTSKKETKTEE